MFRSVERRKFFGFLPSKKPIAKAHQQWTSEMDKQ
jgi:hypothetical protein